jgi:hypothetical protein
MIRTMLQMQALQVQTNLPNPSTDYLNQAGETQVLTEYSLNIPGRSFLIFKSWLLIKSQSVITPSKIEYTHPHVPNANSQAGKLHQWFNFH